MRAAIVLAAGLGTRMGGPKALLLLRGEPLALAHARAAREAGCDRVIVVTSEAAARRLPESELFTVTISHAPDPTGSLLAGAAALDATTREVLIAPVDTPPPDPRTARALLDALAGGARASTPSNAGRGGHPVACTIDLIRELEREPRPLRDALRALGPARAWVEVDDARVTLDLDTPEAWLAFAGEPPRFL